MDHFVIKFFDWGQSLPPEVISLAMIFFCLLCIKGLNHKFGVAGLHVYNSLAICLANIQILHLTTFSVTQITVPLGTVVFTTTFLANGIISQKYGSKEAQKSILLSSIAYVVFFLSMFFSLMHQPAVPNSPYLAEAFHKYQALNEVFIPSLRLFISSLCSFLISQFFYIFIFQRFCSNFFRNSIALFLASIVDHIVFTLLAFCLFASTKPSWSIFIEGYVLGSFAVRLITIGCCSLFKKNLL